MISVIMPCYNHAPFLAQSARSILQQTHAALELIIVDDCSRDDSRRVMTDIAATDPRVRLVFRPQNGGASAARNEGLRRARGELISFCDADDLWLPGKLAEQVRLLRQHPEADVAYSDALIIGEDGMPTGQSFGEIFPPPATPTGDLFGELCLRNFVNIQTVLLRRACLVDAPAFDCGIKWVEDWEYWIRVSRRHRFVYYDQPLAQYRIYSRSTPLLHRAGYQINRYKVFKRTLRSGAALPPAVRTLIWYHMGCCLRAVRRQKLARRFLLQSLATALRDLRSWPYGVRPCARLLHSHST